MTSTKAEVPGNSESRHMAKGKKERERKREKAFSSTGSSSLNKTTILGSDTKGRFRGALATHSHKRSPGPSPRGLAGHRSPAVWDGWLYRTGRTFPARTHRRTRMCAESTSGWFRSHDFRSRSHPPKGLVLWTGFFKSVADGGRASPPRHKCPGRRAVPQPPHPSMQQT